ncbi:MAG: RES family NAD+ phosphorylase [Gammaproteobacteria bacterium]|nr:RES family NAD+ phosphorylase [Gammaproteobacteria bacterium]
MRLYRISQREHIQNLDGLGASYETGGRWNEPGVPALYFGETAAVAMLEMANYLPSPRLVPASYRMGVFELSPDVSVERWSTDELPEDWRDFPYPTSTQRWGTDWLLRGEAPCVAIPSSAVPGGLESIVLASPTRLDRTSVHLLMVLRELYNPRAFASLGSTA